jgi:hypothetical protein
VGFDADDGILSVVEIRTAAQRLDRDAVLLEVLGLALEILLAYVSEKAPQGRGPGE